MVAYEQILALDPLEKIELIDKLLLSLDLPNKELDKIWIEEAEQRIKEYEAGKTEATDIDEILAKYDR